jgi:hypothetical protein
MDQYSHEDTWEDESKVLDLLAHNVCDNRLVLVLGAGTSMGIGLPDWSALVKNAHDIAGAKRKPKISDNQAIENLAHDLVTKGKSFIDVMKKALYSVRNPSTDTLEPFVESDALRSELLEAICTVVMLSCRRGHGTLVTYNFDDLVETYLARRGIFAYPYATQPAWFHNEDVSVLHPHGFLSRRATFPSSGAITVTGLDFDKQTGNVKDPWRIRLLSLLQSSVPLFIGLSGTDQNLSSVLADVSETHASLASGRRYWGVRLCQKDDAHIDLWEHRGVWCETFDSYDDIPRYLMYICERSAELIIRAKLRS